MPYPVFDIEKLSRFLRIPEKQLQKLAERGDLPGRKVKGEWTFAREEVYQWLEKKIGSSDDQERSDVEKVLANNDLDNQETISIASLIPEGAIALELGAKTKDSVIRTMSKLASETGYLWDESKMIELLRQREELVPTAFDNGVAFLHPRRPNSSILAETFLTLGRVSNGVPFGAPFGGLTDIFFLICSTDDRIHLRILARLSRIVDSQGFLQQLREVESVVDVRDLIEETENAIPG